MTSKFEQLIEYVINDEEQKARELFHDIVVEKSREIYENLMNEESEEDLDEAKEEDDEGEELDEAKEEDDEGEELDESEEDVEESIGGDASQGLIDDVEMEEEGMSEGEEEEESGEDLEDRVVDLEDKLDELMAEFEALMGAEEEEHSDLGAMGGDELEMDDTAEFDDGEGEEEVEFDELSENVSLDKAPEPVRSEQASINKKSTVAFNSGAAGMEGKPVKETGATNKNPDGTAANKGEPNEYKKGETTVPHAGKFQNVPGGDKKLGPATKPHLAQATGVNTKTPFPKG